MRKLGRILRRCLTVLSLLLFVAVLAAWVRGYWSWDEMGILRGSIDRGGWRESTWQVGWASGEIGIIRAVRYANSEQLEQRQAKPVLRDAGMAHQAPESLVRRYSEWAVLRINHKRGHGWRWSRGGLLIARADLRAFAFVQGAMLPDVYYSNIWFAFPCWMAAIVFGSLPSWRFIAWWRSRRRVLALRQGRCRGCGYDLRASPQRCPECGLAVEEKDQPVTHDS